MKTQCNLEEGEMDYGWVLLFEVDAFSLMLKRNSPIDVSPHIAVDTFVTNFPSLCYSIIATDISTHWLRSL